jgi:putative methyltransferase (TIGR04325 family)
MTWKDYIESVMPKVALQSFRSVKDRITDSTNSLTYAPDGWKTTLPPEAIGCNLRELTEADYREWSPIIERMRREPLRDASRLPKDPTEQQNAYPTFARVLALTANRTSLPRVLDYGGSLGYYYWVGRAFLPDTRIDYHCKELPEIVERGRQLSPEITWHLTDSCLDEPFDLMMFSGVLPYISDWQSLLRRAATSTRSFLYIALLPAVEVGPSYVAIQRLKSATMLYQVLKKQEVTAFVQTTGLRLVHEFRLGQHLRIRSAPEQPSYCGWLFEKVSS